MKVSVNQTSCSYCPPDCSLFTYTYTIQSKPLDPRGFCTVDELASTINSNVHASG